MTNELRLRREAAQMAYDAARMKDETTTRLEEFRFLGMKMSDVDPDEAYFIKMEKQRIKEKYKLQNPNAFPPTDLLRFFFFFRMFYFVISFMCFF